MTTDLRGRTMLTRLSNPARDVTVVVIAVEQSGKHRGKWLVLNTQTQRRIHRTTRQLREP